MTKKRLTLYHGTNCALNHFDVAKAQPYNVGLHFGTKAAALSRIAYLRQQGVAGSYRLLKCELTVTHPFRIGDVFGHSYAMILDALEREIARAMPATSPLHQEIDALIDEYMGIEDDPNRAPGTDAYTDYCHRLNRDIIRLFSALGCDGIVYENLLEDAKGKADSYVVFDARNITIVKVESVGEEAI